MAMSAEHRSKFAMVTSPHEWKILEWDENPQNKQKNHSVSFRFPFRVLVTPRTEHTHVADVCWLQFKDH